MTVVRSEDSEASNTMTNKDKYNPSNCSEDADTSTEEVEVDGDHDNDTDGSFVRLQVILLVVDPHSVKNKKTARFELLQVEVFHDATTVGDLLKQIQRLATLKTLRQRHQKHKGVLLLLPSTTSSQTQQQEPPTLPNKGSVPPALLFPNDVFIQKLITPLSSSPNHQQKEPTIRSILLVPLPENISVSECAHEARTILKDSSVHQLLLSSSGIDANKCCWNRTTEHPHSPNLTTKAMTMTSRASQSSTDTTTNSTEKMPLPSSADKDPSILYTSLAKEIAYLLGIGSKTNEDEEEENKSPVEDISGRGPCLVGWACQAAVSYYYLSQKKLPLTTSSSRRGNSGRGRIGLPKRVDFKEVLFAAAAGTNMTPPTSPINPTTSQGNKKKKYHTHKNPALRWLEPLHSKYDTDHVAVAVLGGKGGDVRPGFCGSDSGISYADLCTLAGVVAIQVLGGPTIPWSYGRPDYFAIPRSSSMEDNHDGVEEKKSDVADTHNDDKRTLIGNTITTNGDGTTKTTRLKDEKSKQKHELSDFRLIFHDLGFSDRDVVALSGANALARCHAITNQKSPVEATKKAFGNTFFILLSKLDPTTAFFETPTPNSPPRWKKGPITVEGVGSLSFLPSDWVLIDRKGPYYQWVKLYAQEEDQFVQDFAQAFRRLMELGTADSNLTSIKWWTDESSSRI